jgi:hypothetical protein
MVWRLFTFASLLSFSSFVSAGIVVAMVDGERKTKRQPQAPTTTAPTKHGTMRCGNQSGCTAAAANKKTSAHRSPQSLSWAHNHHPFRNTYANLIMTD